MRHRILILFVWTTCAIGQVDSKTPAGPVLDILSSAFSSRQQIASVGLTADAHWFAGGLNADGTATIAADSSGRAELSIAFSGGGDRTESQTRIGSVARCKWSGSDGVVHSSRPYACLQPLLWCLPSLSLQTPSMPANVSVVDLGPEQMNGGSYTHLRLQSTPSADSDTNAPVVLANFADLWIDSVTHLPAILRYRLPSDRGGPVVSVIEVRYEDYRLIRGAQVPFRIERLVNNAPNLTLQIRTATIQ